MKNLLILVCIAMFSTGNLFSQTTTFSQEFIPNQDYFNTSIAVSEYMGATFVAGSTYDPTINEYKGFINIHELNSSFIQSRKIDIPGYDNVKVLDICVTDHYKVAITGVVRNTTDFAFFAEYDLNLNMINYKILESSLLSSGLTNFAGTEIVYNSTDDSYLIGGVMGNLTFESSNFSNDDDMESFVLRFDNTLKMVTWSTALKGSLAPIGTGWGRVINVVNDLTIIGNKQVFVTGSVSRNSFDTTWGDIDGVLALSLDIATGAVTKNYSFFSVPNGGHYQTGVSATFNQNEDRLVLLSNNSIIHNPQVSIIENVSDPSIGLLTTNHYIELGDGYGGSGSNQLLGINPSGLSIEYIDNDRCRISGSYRKDHILQNYPTSSPYWTCIVNINDHFITSTILAVEAEILRPKNLNFSSSGDGVFGSYTSQYPHIPHNPMTYMKLADMSFHLVSDYNPTGGFGYDLVSNSSTSMECLNTDIVKVNIIPLTHTNYPITSTILSRGKTGTFVLNNQTTNNIEYDYYQCNSQNLLKEAQGNEIESVSENLYELLENPVINTINVKISENNTSHFELYDNLGKKVMINKVSTTSEYYQLDVSGLPKGIYFLECSHDDYSQVLKVII